MARKKNPFANVDDIYLTDKNIAVRNVSQWWDKSGKYHFSDKVKYYPRTKENMKLATKTQGWIRKGR